MTREEQIQKAASMHESACLWSDNSTSHKESFIRGAKWSDEHPFEEVIITDRRFILDKVCEFLENHLLDDKDEVTNEPFINFVDDCRFKETFISIFRKAMEE